MELHEKLGEKLGHELNGLRDELMGLPFEGRVSACLDLLLLQMVRASIHDPSLMRAAVAVFTAPKSKPKRKAKRRVQVPT